MITDRQKFSTKITVYGISSFHFYYSNQFNVITGLYTVQETSPNFPRRPTRVDNTADNTDVTQLQAANRHRLLSHVTLGRVECKEINSLCTDSQVLRAEYCIVSIPHNTAI